VSPLEFAAAAFLAMISDGARINVEDLHDCHRRFLPADG
jgi:hypothetical protein